MKIEQLTRELVDIVEQRNKLVELLDDDRKRYLFFSSFFQSPLCLCRICKLL